MYTVSGPSLDTKYQDPGPALSRAITAASTAGRPATYYVRNARGDTIGYAESDEQRNIIVVRT